MAIGGTTCLNLGIKIPFGFPVSKITRLLPNPSLRSQHQIIYRRKWIAKKLVMKPEAQAKSRGCRAIVLHCDTSNPGAIKLCIGQGFRIIKVPEGANWPQPKTSPNIEFVFLMKLLDV